MRNFKPNLIKMALISSGFAVGLPALAQQNNSNEDAAANVEVIQVTGIRGSLQRSQAIKQESTSIVDAISAEDIGKLPDTSIAESLARLPGLAGERRDGRTSGLSIRGFNENYVATSLNGRELLGMGDNRGVEYDLYPSEIVANAVVYKSPEAGLLTQGIGGTVDLQTVSPLGAERTMTFNVSLEQNGKGSANPDFDDNGHRMSFNFVDSFANDTIGVALVLASMESPSQEEHFRAWGYADGNADKATVDGAGGYKVLGGHDSYVRSGMMERDSIAAVVQFAPNDKLKVQMDALYIDFQEDNVKRGLEEGGAEWGTGDYTVTSIDNGLATQGYYDGFHSVIRNDASRKDAELTTLGLNLEYQINDEWGIEVDYSTGTSTKTLTDIESYSGVGRAGQDGRPMAARSWTMTPTGVMYSDHPSIAPVDYTDASLIRLAGPQAWGGGLNPITSLRGDGSLNPAFAQDGFVNQPDFHEELDTLRFSVKGAIDSDLVTGLEAGIVYADRKKIKIQNGAFLTAPSWPGDDAIPNVLGVADLGFIGIDGILAYDSLGLYNSGYYMETNAALVENGRLGNTFTVEEEITTLFVQADLEREFGDVFMRGNIGLQIVTADQFSSGFSTTKDASGFTQAAPVSGGTDYTDVLPSLNLSFEIADGQYIRTALSRSITRPRMDDMRPNKEVNFANNDNQINNPDPQAGPWGGSSGNPELDPLKANQFDLAYEHYFSEMGYYSAAFFYKELANWHRDASFLADFSEIYIPEIHQSSEGEAPATLQGFVSAKEDGMQGFVRGWEFQASIPMDILHESLEGFGIVGSATFLDGKLDDGGRIPGLSEEIYQLTAYYEMNGFEFRVSARKRDEFNTETRGTSLMLVQTMDQGGTLVDAQIGYDFAESGIEALKGLRVTLQAQNLTDEDTIQSEGDARMVTRYQSFGANYLLGLNYSF